MDLPGAMASERVRRLSIQEVIRTAEKPSKFVVHASGDNRYQLFVNGTRVAWGPARGDLFHWRTIPSIFLSTWSPKERPHRGGLELRDSLARGQATNRTGFLLQGDTARERVVDSGPSWKCTRNEAYQPIPFTHAEMRGYYVAGPGDRVTAAKYPWGWESLSFDDAAWPAAATDDRSSGSRGSSATPATAGCLFRAAYPS